MPTHLLREEISTGGQSEVVDITALAEKAVSGSGLQEGILIAFAQHSTVGLTTMECEPGTQADIADIFGHIAPEGADYHHNRLNADTNGHSHARAAVLGASVTVPFSGGHLLLGTWQSLVAIDFDDRPRHRQILLQLIGE
jgi:secondary thiamine-phosphate synthase enzyme